MPLSLESGTKAKGDVIFLDWNKRYKETLNVSLNYLCVLCIQDYLQLKGRVCLGIYKIPNFSASGWSPVDKLI